MASPIEKQNEPLIPVSTRPFNAEAPLRALTTPHTPTRSFFVRSHFDVPPLTSDVWSLAIDGSVDRPSQLGLADLKQRSPHSVCVTLECAGNGRRAMATPAPGLSWGFGAVSTARFTGVRVMELLDRAGIRSNAVEVVFIGADRGDVGSGDVVPYARSLPLEVARDPDTIVAWAMNGLPLRSEHGFPARLVVPRWYAMASVKWLVGLQVLSEPFEGHFQRSEYVYRGGANGNEPLPVTRMRVRAVIGSPEDGEEVAAGDVQVAGTAWSGHAPVDRVDVSVDGGKSWSSAELGSASSPFSAVPWRLPVRLDPGSYSILARATDQAGNTQPAVPEDNAMGYGNNVMHGIRITVSSRTSHADEIRIIHRGSRPVPA